MTESKRPPRDETSGQIKIRRVLARTRPHPKGSQPKAFKRWLRWTVFVLVVGAMLCAATLVYLVQRYSEGLPDVRQLREHHDPQVTRVLDRNGELVGEIFVERRTWIPMREVPRVLIFSFLAAEDADFFAHAGLDYPGLLRAVAMGILRGGEFRGTSTITQQVARNLFLGFERSFARKIRELILAHRIEQFLTKEEILAHYINHINFGHGRYGIEEAALYYFGKHARDLTLAEASLLAGVPQSPVRNSPREHPEQASRRQRYILAQLIDKRSRWPELSVADIEAARTAPLTLAPLPEDILRAPEIVELARRELVRLEGQDAVRTGGYTIHTSIDGRYQRIARDELRRGLETVDGRLGVRGNIRQERSRTPATRSRDRSPNRRPSDLRVGSFHDAIVTSVSRQEVVCDVSGQPVHIPETRFARYNASNQPLPDWIQVGAHLMVRIESGPAPRGPRTPGESGQAGQAGRPEQRPSENEANETPGTETTGTQTTATNAGQTTSSNSQITPQITGTPELGPEGAVVVIDIATRGVLALVGGYSGRGFNRATQARRQPGSTFKPIVFAEALRSRRFTLASTLIDAPGVYDTWRPQNYERWEHRGDTRLRVALADSINSVAVRMLDELTVPSVVQLATGLGLTTPLVSDLSLSLGSSEVIPLELANAYATFAAGGQFEPTRIINRIETADGRTLRVNEGTSRSVLSAAEAYLVTSMLQSVITHGTAASARSLSPNLAGKTGTSNRSNDAWFVGYSPTVLTLVWVGFDNNRSLGARESGARTALPVWTRIMRTAPGALSSESFVEPPGISHRSIDPMTGLLARPNQSDAIDEVFLEGTEPGETAREPGTIDTSTFLQQEMGQ